MPVAAILGTVAKVVVPKLIGAALSKGASASDNARGDALSAEAAGSAGNLQNIADTLGERAEDRWDFYKNYGENVDIMLIDDAVQLFKETFSGGNERAAARAAEDVAAAFDRSAEVRRRAAFRFGGVDPTSGKFQGLERKTETERATAEAAARFGARRTEEDRARAILNNASKIGNRAIGQSLGFSNLGAKAESSAANIYAGQVPDARAEAAGSATLVGDIAGQIPFEQLFAPNAGGSAVSDSGSSDSSRPNSGLGNSGFGVEDDEPIFKDGGRIPGYRAGAKIPGYRSGGAIPGDGRSGGKIIGPGTGRSDSVSAIVDGRRPVKLSAGEFIIPEHIVRQKGARYFDRMIRS